MSTNAIEMALWHICYGDRCSEEFKNEPVGYLTRYRVDPTEQRLIMDSDVRALLDLGVNDMLVFTFFQAAHGREGVPRYMQLVNAQ